MDMETFVAIQLGFTGLLLTLPGSELCKFGPNCDYPCHCQNNAVCDPLDGSCSTGCDDGDLREPGDDWYTDAWSGYGCQLGNVAYGKIATQGVDTWLNYNASLGIDGNHDTDLDNGHCSFATDNAELYTPRWWQVDLGANFVIYSIKLTNSEDIPGASAYLSINVSDTEGSDALCHGTGFDEILSQRSVDCYQPLRGRYVRLQRMPDVRFSHLVVCELQVFGYLFHDCPDAYYGVACGTLCNCHVSCDDISGECPGQNCTEGWMGRDCQTECNPGKWGRNCLGSCNCFDDQEVCDRIEGRCDSGCQSGFGGIGCNEVLPLPNSTAGFDSTSSSVEVRFNDEVTTSILPTPNSTSVEGFDPTSSSVKVRFNEEVTTSISEFPVAMVAGGTIGLIVLVLLVVVIVCMARQHSVCGKVDRKEPAMLEPTTSSLDEDVEPRGQDNHIYAEISPSTPCTSGYEVPVCKYKCNAFLEALQVEETSIPSSHIEIRYPGLKQPTNHSGLSTIQGQYMLLQCSKHLRKPNNKDVAYNHPKNRDNNRPPASMHSAQLTTPIEGRNDYTTAVAVDGYRNRKAYIATQLPVTHTVVDFWRMVYAHKSSCIIALQQPDPEDESTPMYWPTTTENPLVFGHLRVTLVQEESQEEGALSMMDLEITISNKDTHNVRLYQFLSWPPDAKTPLSTEKTLMLLDHVERWQLRSGMGPLWFLCKFGYERCGLMIAACYMLEKLKVDRVVDVFQAVRHVRIAQPEFVTYLAQYEFLYELAIAYINS